MNEGIIYQRGNIINQKNLSIQMKKRGLYHTLTQNTFQFDYVIYLFIKNQIMGRLHEWK
ncbi:hypothetical protein TTHERM_01344700 (macronuclear) [Tetrahymena thermophila SB210]|uniref:Uncharacterized protein n=1 Tax=Tetrahymena thermophila (strain SB210) TaxID=312017 RepID=Q24FS0_TETTS|nr:hypothetical protein TTHERM_01344700 [Tetrahymena thermophila SB210]EAS06625.1 hypothetical protein TTHERM_01344700 [Tetrahymena thermophila SB210]|eukprot:XP_001026870.1 hypothetical protein TTHERM_01344700 [Tetrahymena thermophila SB210]